MKIIIEDGKKKTEIITTPIVENGKKGEKVKIDFSPALNMKAKASRRRDAQLGLAIVNALWGCNMENADEKICESSKQKRKEAKDE